MLLAQLLESLLLLHAETLLLVDDEHAEVAEDDVGFEQAVRADDDVDAAVRQAAEDLLLLADAAEAGDRLDADRVAGQALAEGVGCCSARMVVGASTATCRPSRHGLERGADGDLGLAVADVAADQAVHGAARFHVALDVGGGLPLVGRVLVQEAGLHLLLPLGVGGYGGRSASWRRRTARAAPWPSAGWPAPSSAQVLPGAAADAVQLRRGRLIRAGDPALDQVEAVDGHAQHLAVGVLDGQRLDLLAADPHVLQAAERPMPWSRWTTKSPG
jgi:hypothetical protein